MIGTGLHVGNADNTRVNEFSQNPSLVPAKPSEFFDIGGNTVISALPGSAERVKMPNASGTFIREPVAFAAASYTLFFEWRNSPTSVESGTFSVRSTSTYSTAGGQVYVSYVSPPADWTKVNVTKTESGAKDSLMFLDTGGVDIEIRNIRFIKN